MDIHRGSENPLLGTYFLLIEQNVSLLLHPY